MRNAFVFGRGGPRQHRTKPKYLTQPPPKLTHTTYKTDSNNYFGSLEEKDEFLAIKTKMQRNAKKKNKNMLSLLQQYNFKDSIAIKNSLAPN